jgi:AcrR family transcriptional regulator
MSDSRRTDILNAAAVAIADRGLCETRISDVAEVIGVSPALILYYFPTKAALLSEAMIELDQLFYERVRGKLEQAPTAEDRLMILVEESCPGHSDADGVPDTWALWPATWEMARHDPTLAEARAKLDEAWREQIVTIVEQGVVAGEFAATDAEEFAIQLAAMLDGLAIAAMLGDPTVDTARMSTVARSFCRRTLKGVSEQTSS